jgi:2-oxoglutarate ferredoxin oxidoreductase subunit beta
MPKCLNLESKPSNFCPGCGYGLVLKSLGEIIDTEGFGPRTVFALDIGCNLLAWDYYRLDTVQTHHGRVTPLISGYKRANKNSISLGIAGDGGLYAIGLQSFLHTAHRDEPVTIIGINNTLYAMTGGQAAPTTLPGEDTDTTPGGKFTFEKPIFGPELAKEVAHKDAFLARASVLNIQQMKQLFKQAIDCQLKGHFSYVEVLSYCPTNWKTTAEQSIDRVKVLEQTYKVGVINGAN